MGAQLAIIIASAVGLALYLYFKPKGWREVLAAATISAAWVSLSGIYNYRFENYQVGVNLFPFFAWTGGLVLTYWIFTRIRDWPWAKASALYVAILLAAEYVGYNFARIQLQSSYPGLLGFELLHAPAYAQFYYLLIGPAFLLLMTQFSAQRKLSARGI